MSDAMLVALVALLAFSTGIVVSVFLIFYPSYSMTMDRAIKAGSASYHQKTGEIVWSDNVVRFIVTGDE